MQIVRTKEDLGERNRRRILSEILLKGPLSRTDIAQNVSLTPASVSRITRDLITTGLVEEAEHYSGDSGRGRKFVRLRVRSGSGFVVGIAINVFRQDIVIADLANAEVAQKRLNLQDLSDPEKVFSECVSGLNQLIDNTGIERCRILGGGVAITGAVDPVSGTLRSAPVLEWSDVDVNRLVRHALDIPVTLESIANAKTLAAHCFGPAKGNNNLLLFNASLAIGASLFMDGRLIRGANSSAGLIESMLIPDEKTGSPDTVDKLAGGISVIDHHSAPIKEKGQFLARQLLEVIQRAEQDNQTAQQRLCRSGRALAWVIMQSNALLHPEQILISGPLIESDFYREGIRSRLGELIDTNFVNDKLRFYPMTSHGAAQSLAIYHFLIQGDLGQEVLVHAEGY